MDVFVGAEYLIANALIALKKKGKDYIKLSELHEYGIEMQRYCVKESIHAVFLISMDKVSAAIFNFSDYFSWETVNDEQVIGIKKGTKVEALEERFAGFLPVHVLRAILNKTDEFIKV